MNENPEEWLKPLEVIIYLIVEHFYIPTGNSKYVEKNKRNENKAKYCRWWLKNWGKNGWDDGMWVPVTDETEKLREKVNKIKNRDREIIERFPDSIVPYWHEIKL